MLDFVIDNYIWFIVGGVILVMALIGYIADKTDFGRTRVEKTPKEKKIKKNNREPEKIEVDAKGIDELTKEVSKEEKKSEDIVEPLNTESIVGEQASSEPIIQEPIAPSVTNEDLYAPLETGNEVKDNMTDNTIDPSLYQPLSDDPNSNEIPQQNSVADISTDKQPDSIESEDDIWKF